MRSTAEFVNNYFTKGRMAVVEGKLQIRPWKDRDGNNRRSAEVIVDNIYFGDSKRDGASQGANYGAPSYGAGSYGAAAGGETPADTARPAAPLRPNSLRSTM